MPQNALGAPTIANSTAVTETHPLCKTALATQALFEQVWLSTDDDTKEESTESDDDLSEDLGDNNLVDGSHSDVETSNVIFKQTIHAIDRNPSQPQPPTHLGKCHSCHLTLRLAILWMKTTTATMVVVSPPSLMQIISAYHEYRSLSDDIWSWR